MDADANEPPGIFYPFSGPNGHDAWTSTDGFCRSLGLFFTDFMADRRWYGVVEYIGCPAGQSNER